MPSSNSIERVRDLSPWPYVWKQGMPNWDFAGNMQELQALFVNAAPPQMPGMPPMPGM